VSNDGEILKIGEWLTMLLYHGLNQKASLVGKPFDSSQDRLTTGGFDKLTTGGFGKLTTGGFGKRVYFSFEASLLLSLRAPQG
jgi:hypothetical protein